jgi:hypothetical protein
MRQKKFILQTLLVISLYPFFSENSNAQFKENGKIDDVSIYQHSSPATRLGTGILVWVGKVQHRFVSLERYFYSCNSAIGSTGFTYGVGIIDDDKTVIQKAINKTLQEVFLRVKDENNMKATYTIELVDLRESNLPEHRSLKQGIRDLCSKATPEPKNIMIPISTSALDKDSVGKIYGLISGSFKVSGNKVEGWIRQHNFKRETWLIDNKEFLDEKGKPVKNNTFLETGYELQNWRIDCGKAESAIIGLVKYDKNSQVQSNWTDLQLLTSSSPPGSIGEQIVDTVCKMYR